MVTLGVTVRPVSSADPCRLYGYGMYCENDTITVCVLFVDVIVNRSNHAYDIVYVNVDGVLLTNVSVPGDA